jgi:hypothetical protein
MNYRDFVGAKAHEGADSGFEPTFMPENLFPFQSFLVEWAIRKGRAALFADCGLGKTPMQLVWAENMARHTLKPTLILTPLAVSHQTIREGEKFGIECVRSQDGSAKGSSIIVTNYERLAHFSPDDFGAVVCDESSILKSFDGSRRQEITDFMRKVPYRLLATATAAPNDYIELGTSSEALGYLGHMDMLAMFFKNDQNNSATRRFYGEAPKWRFKGHSETPFWQWVSSWARACRRPSDVGFPDGAFLLPELKVEEHVINVERPRSGMLFNTTAVNLAEQREERKLTVNERCELVASLAAGTEPFLAWCHLNEEATLLKRLIPDCVEVSGSDSDDKKEEAFMAFADGKVRVLVTKPTIGAWGLNFQHCSRVSFFPSHSYEQYYQSVRRCWRFGQKNPVTVDLVMSEGESRVMENLSRKAEAASRMFDALVAHMNHAVAVERPDRAINKEEIPTWL